jgi:1,4-dihydroxy-6-naphthoate synthase
MFYGLATDKLETGDLKFTHVLKDIQTLNQVAMTTREYDVTAVSFHAYAYIADHYILLPHGASIGDGYGPIVVAREPFPPGELEHKRLAVPGTLTSAFLAMKLHSPNFDYAVVPFDQIIDQVVEGNYDAGLLIHEGQLTYQQDGLVKILDLGYWWKRETGLPLPMGGNAIKRELGPQLQGEVSRWLHRSIEFSMENRQEALAYAMQFARDLDPALAEQFVGMYVNHHTVNGTDIVPRAAQKLLDLGYEAGLIPHKIAIEVVG